MKYALRFVALGYLAAVLVGPVALVFYRAFEDGFDTFWAAVTTPEALHALWLTVLIAAIAVPLNTVFGILCALVIVRHRFRGVGLVNALVDLPLALSPIVVGLSLLLLYGSDGWFGGALAASGIQVIFSLPGMVLATIFVSLPFVVREVVPVLREIGTDQEQAAATLGAGSFQTFRRITFPAIRWARRLRRRADDRTRARRVRRRHGRLGPHRRRDADDDDPRGGAVPELRPRRRLRRVGRPRDPRASRSCCS